MLLFYSWSWDPGQGNRLRHQQCPEHRAALLRQRETSTQGLCCIEITIKQIPSEMLWSMEPMYFASLARFILKMFNVTILTFVMEVHISQASKQRLVLKYSIWKLYNHYSRSVVLRRLPGRRTVSPLPAVTPSCEYCALGSPSRLQGGRLHVYFKTFLSLINIVY